MVKKKVRQRIKDLKEIIELWVKFNNFIREARTNNAAANEQEDEFLNIKTILARRQQVLSTTPLKLMNILSQATTLADIIKVPEMQAKKFYADWHETYLNLNELLGRLESGKIEPEGARPVLEQRKRRGCRGCLYNIILFIVFIILACIGFRIYDKKYDFKSRLKGTILWEKMNEKLEVFKSGEKSEEGETK